jgi:hypothetical protein
MSMLLAVPRPPPDAPFDAGGRPIAYRLDPGFNGGADPTAAHCASWSYGLRTPTSDCIGLALWACYIDRKQPGYHGTRGEWLNCASLCDDADGERRFCEPIEYKLGRAGDLLITRDHVGVIVRPCLVNGDAGADPDFDHLVVDCSPRHRRDSAVGLGGPWSDACRVIRIKQPG